MKNLTTSASLWVTAAVGLAVGVGDIMTGAIACLILLASLVVLRPLRSWIRRRVASDVIDVRIELDDGAEPGGVVNALHRSTASSSTSMMLEKESGRYVRRGPPDRRSQGPGQGAWSRSPAATTCLTSGQQLTPELSMLE